MAGRYDILFVVLGRQATWACRIDSSELIPGLFKRLQIQALYPHYSGVKKCYFLLLSYSVFLSEQMNEFSLADEKRVNFLSPINCIAIHFIHMCLTVDFQQKIA
jgi:hypothetical protein